MLANRAGSGARLRGFLEIIDEKRRRHDDSPPQLPRSEANVRNEICEASSVALVGNTTDEDRVPHDSPACVDNRANTCPMAKHTRRNWNRRSEQLDRLGLFGQRNQSGRLNFAGRAKPRRQRARRRCASGEKGAEDKYNCHERDICDSLPHAATLEMVHKSDAGHQNSINPLLT
jgi:hypothetical protein